MAGDRQDPQRDLVQDLRRHLDLLQDLRDNISGGRTDARFLSGLEGAVESLREISAGLHRLEQAEKERRENRLLREIGLRLGRDLDVESLSHLIMDTLGELISFEAAGLYFINPRNARIRWETLRGYDTDKLHLVRRKLDRGIMGWVSRHLKPVIVPEVERDPRYFNARSRTCSELVVPVLHEGRLIGFFNLESDRPDNFGQQDLSLVEVLASQVAQAVEHAMFREERQHRRRVEAELRVARSIQTSLLPREPIRLPDVQIAGVNHSSEAIGGDYYDHFPISEDRIGLVVADVAGKGIPASLIMASFRTGLRLLVGEESGIAGILDRLNNYLEGVTEAETFVTACYGVYHRGTGEFEYVNAGHNPPMLLHAAEGLVEPLEAGGLVLGGFPDSMYELGRVSLMEGDSLLFYTDGLNESCDSAGEEYGVARIGESLLRHREQPPAEMIDALLADLVNHMGERRPPQHYDDDLTMMVLRRCATG